MSKKGKNYDSLEFKTFDAKVAGEDWASETDNLPPVAGIFINGKELVDILCPLEEKLKAEDDECAAGNYGHLFAEELYEELTVASISGTFSNDYGASLLCCLDCGDFGCWSVLCHIILSDTEVVWTFTHNHRKWNYDLKFTFKRDEYEKALSSLKGAVAWQK